MSLIMSRQSRYDLADLALGGELGAILSEARSKEVSFQDIAFGLRSRGVTVSGETIRQWCKALPEPDAA